jgi:SAM-dependent methyltransferase
MLPELDAGGYSRVNGTVEFYLRVSSLVDENSVVMDFGAGRGRFLDEPAGLARDLQMLRGRVSRVIGVDVDEAVTANPAVDEAHVVTPGGPLPLPDSSVDLIVSDFTFEHVDDPAATAAELGRVVRPGGWICARTPNRWGLIAVPARIVPNRLHDAVLRRVQPAKQERDTFPTRYRLNDRAALRRYFPEPAFRHCSYTHESEPAYAGRSAAAWSAFHTLASVTPPPLRSMYLVFLQKA